MIIEAYLTLLRESPRIPTAATIAERAGYSVRSVFERFPDLHALRVAATDYAFTQGTAQAVARDFSGDRLTRLKSHVETRELDLRAVAAAVARAERQPGRFRASSSPGSS